MKHWWRKLWRGGRHQAFCTCQVVAFIWLGRGSVEPGMLMAPDEVEVIING